MRTLKLPKLMPIGGNNRMHTISILESFEKKHLLEPERNIPLDLFIRYYFLDNKSVAASDRAHIVDYVYALTSYKLYLSAISLRPINWSKRLDAFMSKKFDENFFNGDIPAYARTSCPEDLWNLLVDAYGEKQTFDLAMVLNERAPLTVRANTLKTTRHDLLKAFSDNKLSVEKTEHSPNGIRFIQRPELNFFSMSEYRRGLFEVQDEGSQLAAMRIDCKPGDTVLDYCGGAGGKTLAFAPFMHNKGQIFVHDIRKGVLMQAQKRFKRAGITNYQTHSDKVALWKQLKRKCNWILLDVPCSGTGTLRRNPDMKWKFSTNRLQELIFVQDQIVKEVIPWLRKGGRIVYTTWSILPQENLMQVANIWEKYGLELENGKHFQVLPQSNSMDGFFSATLIKKEEST